MAETEGNGASSPKKTEVESVDMSDGRKVDFAGKRKMLKDSIIADGKVGVRLDFRNGQTRSFIVPAELQDQFAAHGAKQKYGDETAGLEDIDDMIGAVDELDVQIQAGKWREERTGGSFAGTSVLRRALVEFSGKTDEQVKAFLEGKSQAEKLALRGAAGVKDIVARLESEKQAKAAKVDTQALLATL